MLFVIIIIMMIIIITIIIMVIIIIEIIFNILFPFRLSLQSLAGLFSIVNCERAFIITLGGSIQLHDGPSG